MSAYLVNPKHIQAIVAWADNHGAVPNGLTTKDLAGYLALANLASVEWRYEDTAGNAAKMFLNMDSNQDYVKACGRTDRGPLPSALEVLKLLNCLDYQCCEPENWESSQAYRYLNQVRAAATRELPGYDQLPWGK
jgi:hypothetical protein